MIKKTILVLFLLWFGRVAQADILKDFDSLGGNDVLMDRAQVLQPNKNVAVVQNRVVDKRWRNEFSLGYSNVVGGDTFLKTQMASVNYHLHFTPRWAVGLTYYNAFNDISTEGRYLIDDNDLVPDIDAPKSGYEVVANYAPIYGKMNMFGLGIVQFDVYGLLSYGNIDLESGSSISYTYGAGLGLWISQHLTARMEIRQRNYESQRFGGPNDVSATNLGVTFGYLL